MKTILITGATSGIGLATARALHQKGFELMLAARNMEKLSLLKTELGENVDTIVCDVTDYLKVQNCIAAALKKFGKLDVLVNNAGLGYFDKVETGKIEEWHRMVDVNVKGLLNCIHAALPHLITSHGHVINVGSVASHHVFVNSGIYCATKHAVFAISESLRLELGNKIRITTISPGAVNTEFIKQTTNAEMLEEYTTYFATSLDAGRVADSILYAIEGPDDTIISEIVIRPNRKSK